MGNDFEHQQNKEIEHLHPRRERLAIQVGRIASHSVMAGLLVYSGVYTTLTVDGLLEENELAHTHPSIVDVTEKLNQAYADSATIVSGGFGTLKAVGTAEQLTPELSKLGHVWALNYDNKGIDYNRLIEVIKQKAKQEHVTKLSFYGDSIGGIINLNLSVRIIADGGITAIPAFTMDSTPYSPQTLQSDYAAQGDFQTWLHEQFPLQTKGKIARWVVEMLARRNQYDGQDGVANKNMAVIPAAWKTGTAIINDTINSPDAASTELMYSTYSEFASTNATDVIKTIANYETKLMMPKTTWNYIGSPNDTIVKTKLSATAFKKAIEQAKLPPLHTVMAHGIVHGEPWQTKELYTTILNKLVPHIKVVTQQQDALFEHAVTQFEAPR